MMPHLVMPNFQPTTMALPTRSTSPTQASEVREIGKEMEIDFHKVVTNVGIKTLKEQGNQP